MIGTEKHFLNADTSKLVQNILIKGNEFTLRFSLIAEPDRPFPQTGWIVLFCLLGFLFIVAFIFVLFHKRTRKQIRGFCCRKYRVLWPDLESQATSSFMTAEDHYEEQATNTSESE